MSIYKIVHFSTSIGPVNNSCKDLLLPFFFLLLIKSFLLHFRKKGEKKEGNGTEWGSRTDRPFYLLSLTSRRFFKRHRESAFFCPVMSNLWSTVLCAVPLCNLSCKNAIRFFIEKNFPEFRVI